MAWLGLLNCNWETQCGGAKEKVRKDVQKGHMEICYLTAQWIQANGN